MSLKLIILFLMTGVVMRLEIPLDQWFWKMGLNDKPWTTIARGLIVIAVAIIVKPILPAIVLMGVTYFQFYDWAINFARRDLLISNLHRRISQHLEFPLPENKWKRRWKLFMYVTFYHGYGQKGSSIYDRAFLQIPAGAEILFKGMFFGTGIWWYVHQFVNL